MKIEKFFGRFLPASHRIATAVASMGVSVAAAAGNDVWSGDVQKGLDSLDKAISLSIVIGLVVVAIGFVVGAIKYFKEDMQGAKDVLLKCAVAGVVVVLAPTLVKFIVGALSSQNFVSDLQQK